MSNMGKCFKCDKTVYQLEGLTAGPPGQTKIFHKLCFKCATCGWQLNLTNYKFWEDAYCKNHYPVTGFGDQNSKHVKGTEDTKSKQMESKLNAPKLDPYNQTVRGRFCSNCNTPAVGANEKCQKCGNPFAPSVENSKTTQ